MPRRKQPLVSVILPVHNAERYLAEAIESILDQSYSNFELVVVDDASTDSSWKIITEYASRNPAITRTVRLKKNRNMGGDMAGNLAFQHTNPASEYIARMDADDIALPDRLERQVAYLERHHNIAVLGSTAEIIDAEGNRTGTKQVATSVKQIKEDFFKVHPLIHPTVMVRRAALTDPKNLYTIKLSANNDYLTFSTMLCQGKKIANLRKPVLKYRVHESNDSIANLKRTLSNTIIIRRNMVQNLGYQPTASGWLVFAAQVCLFSLPESVLRAGYMLARGMYSPQLLLEKIPSFNLQALPIQLQPNK